MTLELRHLSGSRAGEVESFSDATEISVGRNPSNLVRFDPVRDRAVSGDHASITFEQSRWILRDLGSSNGTFVGEERVTEKTLHSGDVIQFGSQGPKLRVTFSAAMQESTGPLVVPAEGRTVMMMIPQHEGGAAPAGAAAATAPRKKKKGGLGRALLIVAAAGVVLVIGLAALLFTIRSSNLRKRQARAAQTTTAAAPVTTTQTAAPQTDTAVVEIPDVPAAETAEAAEAEQLKQQIATTKQNLESAQESIQKVDPNQTNASEVADLKRQVAESQALMEQMTRQLQEKNDEIAAERARAAAQPKVVYVPVPAREAPPPAQQAAPAETPPSTTYGSRPEQPSVATATPPPTTPTSRPTRPSPTSVASAPPPSRSTAPPPPEAPLYKTKNLKLKVSIASTRPEIVPANLPSGTDKGLVSLIGTALVSSGDYVVGANGPASVSVMVTNYKADVKKGVNTQSTASSARKIGKIFGQKIPSTPAVDVKNVSYDAAMSARVRLLDRAGRVLLETEPSSASADRKSKVGLGGVSFNEAVLSDTAVGDVTRKVVADAVDALRSGLGSIEWSTPVAGASKDKVTLGVGSSANVEPGDVFEIVDGQQRVLARVRVTNVSESTSDAAFLMPPGKERMASMTARYLGSENASSVQKRPRTITTRAKTPVYDGPGTSFNQVRELNPGVKMKLQFTVGPWGKAEDGNGTVWVPLASTTIGS